MNWRVLILASHQIFVALHRCRHLQHRLDGARRSSTPTPNARRRSQLRPDGRLTDCPSTPARPLGGCTLLLAPAAPAAPPAAPAMPFSDLAWLAHPAISGMTSPGLDALTAALACAAAALCDAALHRPSGRFPRLHAPGMAPSDTLTLDDKLLALILRDRHGPALHAQWRPARRPPRAHQPPHQRHLPSHAPGRPAHPARPPASSPRSTTSDTTPQHRTSPSEQDQTSALITDAPLEQYQRHIDPGLPKIN